MKFPLLRKLFLSLLQVGVLASATAFGADVEQVEVAKEVASIPEISATILGTLGMVMLVIRRRR